MFEGWEVVHEMTDLLFDYFDFSLAEKFMFSKVREPLCDYISKNKKNQPIGREGKEPVPDG